MPKVHLTTSEAEELGLLIQTEASKILKGDAYLYTLKIPQLKNLIKWMNEHKYSGMRFSGNKSDLINRINLYVYDKEPLRDLVSTSPIIKPMQEVIPKKVVTVSRTKSLLGRDMTFDESRLVNHLLQDPSNKNFQDPVNKIVKVLDVYTGKSGYNVQFNMDALLNPMDIGHDQIHVQIYRKDNCEPLEWPNDARVTLNGISLEVPKTSKKSKKPGLLMTHQGLIIPQHLLENRFYLVFSATVWSLPTDPLFAILQVEEMPLEKLVEKVQKTMISEKTNIKVPGLVCPHLIQCFDQLVDGVKTGDVTKSMVGLNGILIPPKPRRDEEEMVVQSDEAVSLMDNVTLKRIEIPAKSKNCKHKACFDLMTYIQFGHECRCWNCPLCDTPAPFTSLLIDSKMVEILATTKEEKILMKEDGTFEDYPNKAKNTKKPVDNGVNNSNVSKPVQPNKPVVVIEID